LLKCSGIIECYFPFWYFV